MKKTKTEHNFMTEIKARQKRSRVENLKLKLKDCASYIESVLFIRSNQDNPALVSEVQIFGSLSNLLFSY
jgi:hypothetical protein